MKYPNIKAEMGRNNLTIKQLANNLGLATNTISFKLNGKREFTLSEIESIADIFGCSLDYLVGHKVNSSSTSQECVPIELPTPVCTRYSDEK